MPFRKHMHANPPSTALHSSLPLLPHSPCSSHVWIWYRKLLRMEGWRAWRIICLVKNPQLRGSCLLAGSQWTRHTVSQAHAANRELCLWLPGPHGIVRGVQRSDIQDSRSRPLQAHWFILTDISPLVPTAPLFFMHTKFWAWACMLSLGSQRFLGRYSMKISNWGTCHLSWVIICRIARGWTQSIMHFLLLNL